MLSSNRRSQVRRSRFGATCPHPRRKLTLITAGFALLSLVTPLLTGGGMSAHAANDSYFGSENLAINSQTFSLDTIAMTEDGFMMKTSAQTAAVDRSELSDIIAYTVERGDSLSTIARDFGVSMETIIWENNIKNPNAIPIGTELAILPVSGITHTASDADTLASLAAKYKLDVEKLAKQNDLTVGDRIASGEKVIIPGGKRAISTSARSYIAAAPTQVAASTFSPRAIDGAVIVANAHTDKEGKWMIRPTEGVYTSWFGSRTGHWAVDIADVSQPNIKAAADGTIVRSQCGWNGGYGCMIVVDHGDGVQTLYAHMSKLYSGVGEKVKQGTEIGKMGNTGRTHGRTGIHLHFEVIDNGRKKNPLAYYSE